MPSTASSPALGEQGPARGPQHVFVNRRIVRDRTIAHAIQQAYSVATIKERSPEVHLFIELAPDRVDVNVHPTKAEVRFLDQGLVHEVLRRAVDRRARRNRARPSWCLRRTIGLDAGGGAGARCRSGSDGGSAGGDAGRPWPAPVSAPGSMHGRRARRSRRPPGRIRAPRPPPAARPSTTLIRPMAPLGQFRNTFIIAVDDDGLAIIDQHVAHERILFEQISERLTSRSLESQRLLTPVVLERQRGRAPDAAVARGRAGRDSGSRSRISAASSLRVAAVPALLDWTRCEDALRAVAARPRRPQPRRRRRRGAAPDGRDDGVSRGGQGERPAHARKDAVPARRAAPDGALVRLPARPAGRAAADATRDRTQLRAHLDA